MRRFLSGFFGAALLGTLVRIAGGPEWALFLVLALAAAAAIAVAVWLLDYAIRGPRSK